MEEVEENNQRTKGKDKGIVKWEIRREETEGGRERGRRGRGPTFSPLPKTDFERSAACRPALLMPGWCLMSAWGLMAGWCLSEVFVRWLLSVSPRAWRLVTRLLLQSVHVVYSCVVADVAEFGASLLFVFLVSRACFGCVASPTSFFLCVVSV